jgi:hypothetical protein
MSSPSALAEEDEFVWAGGGNFELGVTCAIVASELAHAPTIVAVIFVCVVFSAAVGRWWTLALPLVLACAVFALMPVDRFYERTPEDVQTAVVFGAMYGLVLGTAVLLVRHYVESRVEDARSQTTTSPATPAPGCSFVLRTSARGAGRVLPQPATLRACIGGGWAGT